MTRNWSDWPAECLALRRRLGLTQTAFARKLGVGLSTVFHWEQGTRKAPRGLMICKRIERLMRQTDG